MKKIIPYIISILAVQSICASTFNWVGSTSSWYYHINNSAMWSGSGSIDSSSDLVIDYNNAVSGNTVTQIAEWADVTVNSMTISNVKSTSNLYLVFRASDYSKYFKIQNDLTINSGLFSFGAYGYRNDTTILNGTLNVGGNLNVGSTSSANLYLGMSGSFVSGQDNGSNTAPLYKASIAKNLYIAGGSTLNSNVGLSSANAAYDITSPDLTITGVVVGYNGIDSDGKEFKTQDTSSAAKDFGTFILQNKTNTYNGTNVSQGGTSTISVGGLSGSLIVRNNASGVAKGVLSILV